MHIRGNFNILLKSKDNLDEWMFLISESIERSRIRRSTTNPQINNNKIELGLDNSKTEQTKPTNSEIGKETRNAPGLNTNQEDNAQVQVSDCKDNHDLNIEKER